MPLWIIAGVLVVYGMGYIVFAFVDPPPMVSMFFVVPPMVPSSDGARKAARVVMGAILMVVPLVLAYFMMRM